MCDQRAIHEAGLAKQTENLAASYQLSYKYLFTLNGAAAVAMITIITSYKEKLEFCSVLAIIAFLVGCCTSLIAIYFYIRWQSLEEENRSSKLISTYSSIRKQRVLISYYDILMDTDTPVEDEIIDINFRLQIKLIKKIKTKRLRSMNWIKGSFIAFIIGVILAIYPFLPETKFQQITICDSDYPECNRILAAPSVTKPN